MQTLLDEIKKEASTWSQVNIYFHDSWLCEVFEVYGKYFCLLGSNKEGALIMTVKGLPQENAALREEYESIIPGYYTNKVHWNSILLEKEEFALKELLAFLKESYELVLDKIPRKIKEQDKQTLF